MKVIWIDSTMKCNLACSYCDTLTGKVKNSISDIERFDKIVSIINSINFDVEIRICGGEPTLFKYLDKLLNHLYCIEYVKRIILYTNGTHKLKYINSKIIIYTSFHLEYPELWYKVLENTKKYRCIYNILVKEFDEYPHFNILSKILHQIPKYSYVHIQYVTDPKLLNGIKNKGTWINFKKFSDYIKKFGVSDYYDITENDYLKKMVNCHCNLYSITENGNFKVECKYYDLAYLTNNKKKFCKNITCSMEELKDNETDYSLRCI